MFNSFNPETGPIEVQGIQLRCVVCRHDVFWERKIQLPTPAFNFFDIDAWNRVAQSAVCARCGYVHMFLPPLNK